MAGSSPLARGLLRSRRSSDDNRRIIPARAGFTSVSVHPHRESGDHPRSRGVYCPNWSRHASCPGSSPLARGLPFFDLVGDLVDRIIPARAGFTLIRIPVNALMKDHPRSRGVYGGASWRAVSTRGSSPLARGLRGNRPLPLPGDRIIPARAGFTRWPRPGGGRGRDHPRSRGVYDDRPRTPVARGGSSPLARGLQREDQRRRYGRRIIPARAGFTVPSSRRVLHAEDHPRSRGVYFSNPTYAPEIEGSSPLARGLRTGRR